MLRQSLNGRAYVPTCKETVTLTRMSYAQPTQNELARPYYTFQSGSQEASVVPNSLAMGCGGEPITPSCTAPEPILMPQRGPGGLAFDQLSPLMTAGMKKKTHPNPQKPIV